MQFKHYCNHSCHYCMIHDTIITTMIVLGEKGRREIILQQSTHQEGWCSDFGVVDGVWRGGET